MASELNFADSASSTSDREKRASGVTHGRVRRWQSRREKPSDSSPARNFSHSSKRIVPLGPVEPDTPVAARVRDRYWLHILLFLITLLTTTGAGAAFSSSFEQNRPLMFDDFFLDFSTPAHWLRGLPYSLTLVTVLLAHEMGHYLACRYYGISASLPYFIGVPTLIGTLGAFIRIRSAIFSRKQLFDIGIAGPLAGFALILPALAIGLAYSKVIPGIVAQGEFVFGTPILLRALEWVIFPGVSAGDIYLHPIARAAWFGVLATALNLMPIGQLDGGHILYALAGQWHRPLTRFFILVLVAMGFFLSYAWLIWAVVLFVLARRHPRIYDETSVGTGRMQLGVLSLVIFIVSFSLVPIRI
jgi:Zn-dependent protease